MQCIVGYNEWLRISFNVSRPTFLHTMTKWSRSLKPPLISIVELQIQFFTKKCLWRKKHHYHHYHHHHLHHRHHHCCHYHQFHDHHHSLSAPPGANPVWGPLVGAYYNGPKFKYQLLSGTGWFSYKIWTKNSKTPMVNLLKNLRPFWNYNFKIQGEINFFTFLKYWSKLSTKFFWIWIGTFSFQICFRNQFWISGSGQTENAQILVFAYFPFEHFPKSKIDSKSKFEMKMSIVLF